MAGTGIWLSDQDLSQTGGAIWAQQQIQGLGQRAQQAQDWANEQIARAQQQAQAQLQQLSQAPAPTPAPVPTPAPPPTPTPAPAQPAPTQPAPMASPALDQTPTPAPMQAPMPAPAPAPAPPDQSTSMLQAGQSWADQQIQKLLNPQPQPTPDQTGAQGPISGPTDTSARTPQATPSTPGAPSGPQPNAPGDLIDQARQAAAAAGIDPDIFTRQIQQESGFNPNAQSGAGAIGIAQFMPATAQGMGIDPTNPQQSLQAAAKLDAQNLQKYGGDWSKALAAYNAGPGNVDQYGGVPPFQETQTYVKNILGGAQNLVQQGVQGVQNLAQQGLTAVNTAKDAVQSQIAARTSQFGMGLSSGDAMAFCGPAAAIAFAQTYGRNPTVDEAKQLAQQVGWNPDQGMAGAGSEVNLLKQMGVDAHLTNGVDWSTVAQDASSGNPVIIDTPGHYYYVQGYNPDTGKFNVGTSGTDLKGGSEWMSADQINAMPQSGGSARAAIYADHPLSGPGQAATVASTQPSSLTMGGNLPGGISPTDIALGLAPFGIGPGLQAGGTLISSLLNPSSAPGPLEQRLASQVLSSTGGLDLTTPRQAVGDVTSQAQQTLQAVQDVGSQSINQGLGLLSQGRDLLSSGNDILNPGLPQPTAQNDLLQPLRQDLSAQGANLVSGLTGAGDVAGQALNSALGLPGAISQLAASPQLQDLLSNPVAQQVGGQILAPMLGMPGRAPGGSSGVDAFFNALNPMATPDTTPLGSLASAVSQANIPVLSGAASLAQPLVSAPGVLDSLMTPDALARKYGTTDSSQYSPADQQKLADSQRNAMLAVGGMTMPAGLEAGAADQLAQATGRISPYDWLRGFYRGGIISAPSTMADVAMNSTVAPIVSMLTGYGRDALTLSPDRMLGRTLGTSQGMSELGSQFLDELKPGAANPQSLIGRAAPGAEQLAAYAAEGAGRLHGAFSQASSNLTYLGELGAMAGDAAGQVADRGTQAWRDAFDAFMANPPEDAQAAAQATGARSAATQDLTGISGWLARGATAAGERMPLVDALFPIVRKGLQLGNRMVEFSPLGTAGTAIDVAKGLLGKGPYAGGLGSTPAGNAVGPLSQRLANNAIGMALTYLLGQQAIAGNVTGSWEGLTPEQQDVLRAQGQIPNGMQLPDGAWHDWSKLPPILRGPLIAAGAYADAQHAYDAAANVQRQVGPQAYGAEDPREAAAVELLREVGGQLAGNTPLRQWSNVYDAATGGGASPYAAATGLASDVLGSLVPESAIVRTIAQATDPNQRQVFQPKMASEVLPAILQNLQQNLPGIREGLPTRVDVLGRDVNNPQQGLGAVLPLRVAPGEPSPLLSGMAASGFAPSAAPPSIAYGADREIKLTPQEQRQFEQLAGQRFQQMASTAVSSPAWQALQAQAMTNDVAGNRARALMQSRLQPFEAAARTYAENQLLRTIPADQRLARSQYSSGIRAPVYGYGPNVQGQAVLQQALLQSLLGSSAGPSAGSALAARLAGIG